MASEQNGEAYEQENVHAVYQQIAQHFSATRYKVCVWNCLANAHH
jgi:tRNA (uracil-5-)-methyltransferase TRM9